MKKTLIALAALAATGASFAQVTMVGNIGFSYQKSPAMVFVGAPSAKQSLPEAQGLAVNDGEIYVTATEDLGGGYSASARGGWTVRGRDGTVNTRDATVTLTTPVGRIIAGAVRTCGSLVEVQSGVVTGTAYSANESNNNLPLDKCSMIDTVTYAVPVGPVTVMASYLEYGGLGGQVASTGYGGTDYGNSTGITVADFKAIYTAGPLMLRGEYAQFSSVLKTATNGTPFTGAGSDPVAAFDGVQRVRLTGTYDFGMAKVGFGYQNINKNTADQYLASIAVPMGAVTVGVDYTARAEQGKFDTTAAGAAATYALSGKRDGDKAWSSVGVGATYSFSKMTTLNVSYISYQDAGANTKYAAGGLTAGSTPALLSDEYRIRLMKAF